MNFNMDVELLESFALSPDRRAALARFVPGTEQHFVASWLLAEQSGYPAGDVQSSIDDFCSKRGDEDALVRAYKGRRKLVQYDASAPASAPRNKETVDFLVRELGLTINPSRPGDAPPPVSTLAAPETDPDAALPSRIVDTAPLHLAPLLAVLAERGQDLANRVLSHGVPAFDRPEVLKVLRDVSNAGGDGRVFFELLLSLLRSSLTFPGMDEGEGGEAGLADLVLKAGATGWAARTNQVAALYAHVFDRAPLSFLGTFGARGGSSVVDRAEYGGALLLRLAPPHGTDFKQDKAALLAYLGSVSTFLDTQPPASFRFVREAVLYHRLRVLQGQPLAPGGLPPLCSTEGTQLLEMLLALAPRQRHPYGDSPASGSPREREELSRVAGWLEMSRGGGSSCLALPTPQPHEVDDLVRQGLFDIFGRGTGLAGENLSPWSKYVSGEWLMAVQAEARLTRGTPADIAACGAWALNLAGGTAALQELRDRVVLEFGPSNSEHLPSAASAPPVTLSLFVKSVPRVTISVYELNTTSYYTSMGKELPSDIPLDGLLPSVSYAWDFTGQSVVGPVTGGTSAHAGSGGAEGGSVPVTPTSPASNLPGQPLRLHNLQVPLPTLTNGATHRGVWVVEVVGGGRSCRAFLRRGALRFVERRTVAGHLLTVIGEDNTPLPADKVSIYLGGRRYTPEPRPTAEGGSGNGGTRPDPSLLPSHEVLIPYAPSATSAQLVLVCEGDAPPGSAAAWSFASLASFNHTAEAYTLSAAWGLERESLVRDNYSATLLVRPRLLLHGDTPAPLTALTNVTVLVAARDASGSVSERVERNLSVTADKELAVTFAVPPDVRSLSFTLSGDVELVSGHAGGKTTLSASHSVTVNGIDAGQDTKDVHLRYSTSEGYSLLCLGKTGEPCQGVVLTCTLRSSALREGVEAQAPALSPRLRTDAAGRVTLGDLPPHISRLVVTGPWGTGGENRAVSFELLQDVVAYPTTIHTITRTAAVLHTVAGGARPATGAGGSVTSLLSGLMGSLIAAPTTSPAAVAGGSDVIARFPFRPQAAPEAYVLSKRDFSLLEVRPRPQGQGSAAWQGAAGQDLGGASVVVADAFSYARFNPTSSMIEVVGLPAGFYEARVKRPSPGAETSGPCVSLRVLPASSTLAVAGTIVCGNVQLQSRPGVSSAAAAAASSPLQITSCKPDYAAKALVLRVVGGAGSAGASATSKDVRVHLLVTHFVPHWECGSGVASLPIPGLGSGVTAPPASRYLNGRTLGEEQRYVLDRQEKARAGGILPGNLLPRPQLLLNPVSLGPVGMDTQDAAGGTAYDKREDASMQRNMAGVASAMGRAGASHIAVAHASFVTLDFLRRPASVLANLRVDPTTGTVTVPLALLVGLAAGAAGVDAALQAAGEVLVTAVAVDVLHTVSAPFSVKLTGEGVASGGEAFRDLANSTSQLDPDSHVLQRSKTAVLATPGSTVHIAAAASFTKAEVYGSLDRCGALLASLAGGAAGAKLNADFSWLFQWPVLSDAARAGRYSKWACHEVHAWLWWKAPSYFDRVLAPYLVCKRSMSVVDHFLLGTSLALQAVAHGVGTPSGAACAQRAARHWRTLRTYAAPFAFARLNAFEQGLVVSALSPSEAAATARGIADAAELMPVSSATQQRVFKAALASNALSGARDEDMAAQLAEAAVAQSATRSLKHMSAPLPRPGVFEVGKMGDLGPSVGGGARMMKRAGPSTARRMEADAAPEMMMGRAMPQMRMMAAPAPMAMAMAMPMMAPMGAMMMEAAYDGGVVGAAMSDDFGESEAMDDGDMALRDTARDRQGYQPLDKTEEYAEAGYHGVHRDEGEASTVNLVPRSPLWADFAAHVAALVGVAHAKAGALVEGDADDALVFAAAGVASALRDTPFLSPHFALSAAVEVCGPAPSGPLSALLLTLAVLGLSMERETDPAKQVEKPRIGLNVDRTKLVYTSGRSPAVLFYQDIFPAPLPATASSVLVGQAYVDPSDPHTYVKGSRVDKFLPVSPLDGSVEVVAGRVYECRVVVSNISAATQALSVLLHVPQGSMPCKDGSVLCMKTIELEPYKTTSLSYPFYLPRPGSVRHFPVHVYGENEAGEPVVVAHASPVTLSTVHRPTVRDVDSWAYVAANGSEEEVVAYLTRSNTSQTCSGGSPPCPLAPLLWRLAASPALWKRVVTLLSSRRVMHEGVWALAFKHGDLPCMRELLSTEWAVSRLRGSGSLGGYPCLTSPLLTLVGEEGVGASSAAAGVHKGMPGGGVTPYRGRGGPPSTGGGWEGIAYEHLEYSPLVNARAHQLGSKRKILNHAVARQWRRLLMALACKAEASPSDLLAVSYLLLLQDRVEDAMGAYARVTPPPGSVAAAVAAGQALPVPAYAGGPISGTSSAYPTPWPALQYDYMGGYLDFYRAELGQEGGGGVYSLPIAKAVAAAYSNHPVPKWKARFTELADQLAETVGGGVTPRATPSGPLPSSTPSGLEAGVSREVSRETGASSALAREPVLELSVEGSSLVVLYANLVPTEGLEGTAAVGTLRLFAMDLELLFSTSPFTAAAKANAGGGAPSKDSMFSYIRPNHSEGVVLPVLPAGKQGEVRLPLPHGYAKSNVMMEVAVGGLRRSMPYYATAMSVVVLEPFGRLRVTDSSTGQPLPRVYVKVYGTVQGEGEGAGSGAGMGGAFFYKDCYTDARGVADYTSLSTDELARTKRFAILVSSARHGALVRTATPPGSR